MQYEPGPFAAAPIGHIPAPDRVYRMRRWLEERSFISFFGPFVELDDAVLICNPWRRSFDIDHALEYLRRAGKTGLVLEAVDVVDGVMLIGSEAVAGRCALA